MAGSSGALELMDPTNLPSSPSRGQERPVQEGFLQKRHTEVKGEGQAPSTKYTPHPRPAPRLLCPAGPPKRHTNKPQRVCPHGPRKKRAWGHPGLPGAAAGRS